MFSLFVFLLSASIFNRVSFGEVAVLGSGNFAKWIEENPVTLVMFYAPWCSHSKQFAPEFDYIDQMLENDKSISLAKVDCVEEKELYWSENIENFPTLKAYIRGEPVHYKGERGMQDVVDFIRRLAARSVINLDEEGGLRVFKSNYLLAATPVVVLFVEDIPNSSSLIDHFDLACKKMATLKCSVTSDYSSLPLGTLRTPTLAVIRSFEKEPEVIHTSNQTKLESSSEMLQYIQSAAYPSLVKFSQSNDDLMFSEKRPGYHTHVLLIIDPKNVQEQTFLDSVRILAEEFNGQCIFVHIDPTDKSTYVQSILSDIVIPADVTAAAMIVKSKKTEVQFFRLTAGTDVNIDSISYWVRDFFGDRLRPSRTEVMQTETK